MPPYKLPLVIFLISCRKNFKPSGHVYELTDFAEKWSVDSGQVQFYKGIDIPMNSGCVH